VPPSSSAKSPIAPMMVSAMVGFLLSSDAG
jgi:hypothetical protein